MTRCLLSLSSFSKLAYTIHTFNNVSIPHVHESLGVGKEEQDESKISKAITS